MKRALSIAAAVFLCSCASGPVVEPGPFVLGTGAKGGGFYPYGEAVLNVVAAATPVRLTNRETAGSNENLRLLESGAVLIALVNMGPAYEAHTASGSFAGGPRMQNLRALLPMYETPFHYAVPNGSAIRRVRDLGGKRV